MHRDEMNGSDPKANRTLVDLVLFFIILFCFVSILKGPDTNIGVHVILSVLAV